MTPLLLLFLACERAPSSPLAHEGGAEARVVAATTLPRRVVVCPGSGDYDTIQDAIDGAVRGATILVCAGTYDEDLTIRNALTLRSERGRTTIRGTGSGPVIDVDTRGSVTIQGFTITGGSGDDGGGIAVQNAEVAITGNRITGNVASGFGGGIWLDGASGTVTNNTIADNEALEGGGIATWDADVTVEANTISDNHCTTTDDDAYGNGAGGGGIFIRGAATLVDNDIYGNDSSDNGGGAFFYLATGEVRGNRVYANTTWGDGGGLYFTFSQGVDVLDNEMYANYAGDDGGGMRTYRGGNWIVGNDYHDNEAVEDGGGMKLSHEVDTIEDNTFVNNVAGEEGGGLELDDETSDVIGCSFVGNRATRGGGLHSWQAEAPITFGDLVFEDNEATECGGAIAVDNDPFGVTVRVATMTGNTAPDGAAFCMTQEWQDDEQTETDGSLVRMQNVLIVDNLASNNGAAFDVTFGTLTVRNATVVGSRRGTIGVEDGLIAIDNTIFADGAGRFADVDTGGVASIRYSLFWSNSGGWGDIADPVGSNGNILGDPLFVDEASGDYSLDAASPAIDAGLVPVPDADGTRSDIGKTGGPFGW
jgi:parallel beta-helix repeat protein/predicted outer membrane repeat protein